MRGGRAVGEAPARCRPRPAPRPLAPRAPAPEAARTAPRAPEPPRERPSRLESARGRREGLRVPSRQPHSPRRRSGPATRVVGALRHRGDPALASGILLHRKLGTPLGWHTLSGPGLTPFARRPGWVRAPQAGVPAAPCSRCGSCSLRPPDKTHFGEMRSQHVVLLLRAALGPAFVEVSNLD